MIIGIGGLTIIIIIAGSVVWLVYKERYVVALIPFTALVTYFYLFFAITTVSEGIRMLDKYDKRIFPSMAWMKIYKPMMLYDKYFYTKGSMYWDVK